MTIDLYDPDPTNGTLTVCSVTAPSMYDSMISGAQPVTLTLSEDSTTTCGTVTLSAVNVSTNDTVLSVDVLKGSL